METRRAGRSLEVVVYSAILLGLVAWSLIAARGEPSGPEDLIGSQAPNIEGRQVPSGIPFSLSSLGGRTTVVVFWLPSCDHCQEFLPALQKAWLAAAPDAHIVTVGMDYQPEGYGPTPGFESPAAFVASTGLTLPTIEAPWAEQKFAWGFGSVPTTYVLDADHEITAVFRSGADPAEVIAAVGG